MPVIAEDNIVLRIIAETQKASREIDQLDRRVEGLEGSTNQVNEQFAKLGKFARNAAIVAVIAKMTQGMARFASQSVKAYAEFEKTQKSFEVLVGNVEQANKLIQDLRKFAKETPFTTDEVTRSAKTLLGFGRAAQDVMKDIEKLGELSAATGANLTQVALVYGQVASLGKLQGQDALQFINAGIPVYDLLAQSMGKSVGELKKLQEQGKITFADLQKSIYDASEAGGKFEGAIKAQATTLAGLQNQIIGGIDDIKIAIGEKFAPAIRSAFGLIGQLVSKFSEAVDGIDNDFVLKIAAGLDAATESLDAFSNVVTSWVNLNKEQFKLFELFFIRLGATAAAAFTAPGSPQRMVLEGIQSQFDNQQTRTKAAEAAAKAYQEIARGIFNKTYDTAIEEYRKAKEKVENVLGGTGSNLIKELTVGGDPKKTEGDLVKGVESLVKAALKAYAITTRELLGRTKAGLESTLQQRKEAQILSVFLARDLAETSAQEFRNFHKYASEALGADNLITLMIEGYLKDAEGKEVDQDLVARIGGKLMDSINKWAERQRTAEDNKPGFLQNLLGLNDKQFDELGYYSDMVLKSAVDLTNSLVNEEIRRTDLLIQASRDRLQQLQAIAGEGNAEQLQLEEQRQRELLQQREEYIQRQRQLNAVEIAVNNAITVSNILTGISKSFAANPVLGIVQGLAAAGLIAATIASVNAALTSVPAYWKGTEFVTGEGGIDNVPALLSRGERVVDKGTNATLNRWGVKNEDLLPLVGSALGKYGPVSLYQGENVSRREFKDLSSKLDRVEKAIYGIQFNVNIDPDGIGVAAGNYRNRQAKRNKLLS